MTSMIVRTPTLMALVSLFLFSSLLCAQTAEQHLAQGDIAFNAYQLSKAERSYLLALREDQNSLPAMNGLIRLYQVQKRYEEGISMVEQAIKLGKADALLWISKGLLLRDSGNIQKSNQAFMQAVEHAGTNDAVLRQAEDHFYSVGNQILAREIGIQRKQVQAGANQ